MSKSGSDRKHTLAEIAVPAIATLGDLPTVHGARTPDRVAMLYEGRETTYGLLDRKSNQVAQALRAEGLRPGERIAYLDRNSDSFFVVLFGAAKAGVTLVPVNFRLAPAEVAFILEDCQARLLFAGIEYQDTLRVATEQAGGLKTIWIDGSGEDSLDAWISGRADTPLEYVGPGPRDTAVQMYTSGTTGLPKGVELSHFAMIRAAVEGLSVWPAMFREDAAVLATMPLFHIAACNLGIAGLYAGGRAEIVRGGTPLEIIQLIADHKITITPLPAALIHDIIRLPEVHGLDLSHLDTLLIAGSGIPVELLREAQQTLHCGFALSYGMTECCGGLTYLGPEDCTHDAGDKLKSAGRAFGSSRIRIAGPDGKDLPTGEIGEILCQSDRVMSGYWHREEASREALRDGWYHSGDAGYLDAQGYLYVVDRIKDMVVSGGENIYPVEVENALMAHPAIGDIAVIGVPEEKWGESLLACLVLKPGVACPPDAELIDFLRPRLAGYKIPRRYTVLKAFPRNATGKVLKHQMRAEFAAPVE